MKKIILKNGLTLLLEKRPGQSVTVQVTVRVGSNYEKRGQYGISHFVEHMLFEGTQKRQNSTIIANEIERFGGDLNAYTTKERTSSYIKVPAKHLDKALDILSDMMQHPLFDKKMLEKERKIILKEINMITDQPRYHQWILFEKTLFQNHPSRNPTYGTREDVSAMKQPELLEYYRRYYAPNNMILAIVGNVAGAKQQVSRYFSQFKRKRIPLYRSPKEPVAKSIRVKKEKKKILNSYMVMGYKTALRFHRDSYALDVIKALLSRGQSGRIVEEIRNKRGLAYEVDVLHEATNDYGFFAIHLNTDKKNIPLAKKIILDEIRKLGSASKKELDLAKSHIEGRHILENEDTHHLADWLNFWELSDHAKKALTYMHDIKKVTLSDIKRVWKKYLDRPYALSVIEQKGSSK